MTLQGTVENWTCPSPSSSWHPLGERVFPCPVAVRSPQAGRKPFPAEQPATPPASVLRQGRACVRHLRQGPIRWAAGSQECSGRKRNQPLAGSQQPRPLGWEGGGFASSSSPSHPAGAAGWRLSSEKARPSEPRRAGLGGAGGDLSQCKDAICIGNFSHYLFMNIYIFIANLFFKTWKNCICGNFQSQSIKGLTH